MTSHERMIRVTPEQSAYNSKCNVKERSAENSSNKPVPSDFQRMMGKVLSSAGSTKVTQSGRRASFNHSGMRFCYEDELDAKI